MQKIRTSSLFHYTTLDSLKQILSEGIIPNYCKEDLSTDNIKCVLGIPMVCFCDIPLTRVSEFTAHYGQYAIGLKKEYAIQHGLNPILYVANADIISSLSFFRAYEIATLAKLKQRGGTKTEIRLDLSDPESMDGIKYLINYNNSHAANTTLFGFVKKYACVHKGIPYCNYNENEWRYLLKEEKAKGLPWFWDEASYTAWRGTATKPLPTTEMVARK